MKKYIVVKILALVLISSLVFTNAKAQSWELNWQSVSKRANIKFVNANLGYRSSDANRLIPSLASLFKTTNGGSEWTKLNLDTTTAIGALDFINPDFGFVCLSHRAIAKTTNGGTSWTSTSFSGLTEFKDIQIINSQLVYAITATKFLKSTNAGQNWTLQAMPEAIKLHFVNENIGFVLGNTGLLRKTTNAGVSWQDISSDAIYPLLDIHFLDANNGYVCGDNGLIMQTSNGGINWASQTTNTTISFNEIRFTSQTTGYAVGGNTTSGQIFTTTNAGQSWQAQFSTDKFISGIAIGDQANMYAYGGGGLLIKTSNQGTDWKVLNGFAEGIFNKDIYFPTARTGYILHGGYFTFQNILYLSKTTDAGASWISKPLTAPMQNKLLNTIFFTDSLNGFIGGQNGQIFKTSDGGQSWQTQNSGTSLTIERIYFNSSTTGFAIGGQTGTSIILRTTNAGTNWIPLSTPMSISNLHLKGIWFISPLIGFIAGQGGSPIKTTDGGLSWNTVNGGINSTLNSVWFKDQNTGFIGANNGQLIKTSDGGLNWTSQSIGGYCNLYDLKCIGNNCYAVGSGGLGCMYGSTNMGQSWFNIATPTGLWFGIYERVYFTPGGKGYLISEFSYLFEYNPTGSTSILRPKTNKPALSFDLYPNPSSDANFTIRHSNSSKTIMTITTTQGKIISKSVLDKAEQQIKLPSGLYFVKIENKEGYGVQKLILY